MKTSLVVAGAAAAVLLTAGGATATWVVMDDQEASSSGQCAGATATLESEREDGVLEVSFELQSSEPGQTWQVSLEHDGEPLLDGARTTDEDAELDVDVHAPRDSTGEVTATATPQDVAGAEECSASLTLP